jgi:hypothetical protein
MGPSGQPVSVAAQKYEVWLGLAWCRVRGENRIREAVDRAAVGRSAVMKLR